MNTTKQAKAARTKKPADMQAMLAAMERQARDVTRAAAELREEIVKGGEKGRMLPVAGSRWRKHPAFAQTHERDYVWTFLMWAWGGRAGNDHLFVLENLSIDPEKPYIRAVEMREFFAEFVPAKRGSK